MKQLERDLGLPTVLAISVGAMIGSGIFILPALALKTAGPSVVLAYLLAGILVVPAALSKSEMATAMPEAGGTYLYIERGMGPLFGTVAGVGTWFSLAFKGGLALVGGVPYLLILFDLPVKPVALGLAAVLILVNLLGAKQTGRLQVAIVVVMLAALSWFVVGSGGSVQQANFQPFYADGLSGLLAATGLVFVSYAGVTKVASVAEEVENPDRNIPLGILGSLAFTTLLYVLIVAIIVGVTDAGVVAGSATPVAEAAAATLGEWGVWAVVLAAILALISTANAGILSSSRYPFAMARDGLVPTSLAEVSERFGTPSLSISLTGIVLLALIAFVPVLEIAKLASAFQILVFVLINVAIVAFREGEGDYEPSFESPLYPWMQVAGVLSGTVLLTQMGPVAIVGAVVITVGSVLWYVLYARPNVERQGAAADAVGQGIGDALIDETESAMENAPYEVLVAITREMDREREAALLRIAADLVRPHDGRVVAVWFEEVPDQMDLETASETQSPADVQFEEQTDDLADDLNVAVDAGEIVSHDTKHAIVNFARHRGVDAIVAEHEHRRLRSRLLGDPVDWVVDHAPCDVLLVDNRGYDRPERIAVEDDGGPFHPNTVAITDTLAAENGGRVVFSAGEGSENGPGVTYREQLADLLSVPVSEGGTETAQTRPDMRIRRGADHRLRGSLFDRRPDGPADSTEITVHAHESEQPGLLRRLFERIVF
ncbi:MULTISPECIES: amino acid transporter [Halomicrobium]|uniref:Amino acid permease-associated region n=2 Tax=Halomicrobium mukohataei TaxID=57705 RepID=C7NZW9_HALMD|nr:MULTISPECIES: amino acid transporter [Halomicrobium]ACV46877.1 amino acid permease-associated region [Halomicrobium mukohataei DSM 12286]QCD65378.1 amino acid permease [Halomicrobium mukohataei]QFR20184.1 amino acid permease [Halomicrobium sp. ZPS1]